jgi:osmotically-inducible protein OsmY
MEIKNKMKATLLSFGAIAVLLLGGCSQEAKEDMSQAGDAASTAAAKTGEAAAKTGEAAATDVKKAGDVAAQTAKDAAANVADATMTPKVKAALQAAAGLETKDINVETANNTITLKGSVPDEKQKAQAETVAKGVAGTQYKLDNQLTVSGATGATTKP